jgi:glutamate-ammonia-ligase adenylyltransferase
MKKRRAPARSEAPAAAVAARARPAASGGLPRSAEELKGLLARHAPVWQRRLAADPSDAEWLLGGVPLDRPRSLVALEAAWQAEREGVSGFEGTFAALREVKRREMLRITVRDLAGHTPLEETVSELSALADFCLRRGLEACLGELSARHGPPSTGFGVFAMGKLGGQELNYSSDIDLVFAYGDEGSVGPLTHHDFFTRVTNRLLQGFRGGAGAGEGALFRVDLRLRPENKSGPIVRSLESYENYYAGYGETWERMALQKCRLAAGDPELGYEFIQRLQPFCFPRYLPPQALDEIFQIKSRIEAEILKEGGLERHVKLGRGGIREIEFSVQALQLIHGARHAFSQESGTLKSIQALHRLELVGGAEALALTRAYIFFRRVEHRLQMREDRQTHTIPESKAEQAKLAEGLGFASLAAFEKEWGDHRAFVRQFFQSIVRPNVPDESPAAGPDAWESDPGERARAAGAAGFADPARAEKTLSALASGPEYAHVSQRTRGFFGQVRAQILRISPSLARPDHALTQFERFIEGYGSRAALYELLASNPKVVEMLFQLFDHSQFLADVVVRQPGILESIAYEGLISIRRDRAGMEEALARESPDGGEAGLREFQRSELVRIELRDILGVAGSLEETFEQLTLLADACVGRALASAASAKGGGAPPMSVIALGKYGGRDLSYGADLDVIFVGGAPGLAAKLIGLLGRDTGDGALFKVDARLRPDGEDGPLALPLEACARYYRTRAQFWERQSLTRARPAAGDEKLGRAFLRLVDEVIYARPVTGGELEELAAMRGRIEKERGDAADPARDFKTGAGGLVEVEFLAQALQLRHGHRRVPLRRASTLEVIRAMPGVAGWAGGDAERLAADYLWLRGLESAARRFHNAPASQLPKDRAEWAPVARHLGLDGVGALEKELAARRARVRALATKLAPKA